MVPQTVQVPGQAGQLATLTRQLEAYWACHRLPGDLLGVFALALEELFINVCTHATPAGQALVVELQLAHDARCITLRFSDNAQAFDPTQVPTPALGLPLEERRVGGLGLHLVRQAMHRFEYHRDGQRNTVLLSRTRT